MVVSASGIALGNSTVNVNASATGGGGGGYPLSYSGSGDNGGNGGSASFASLPYGQSNGGNVNVTGLPVVGGNVPSEDDTVQLGVTATVFPYWSLPVALNDCWPPTRTWARAGDTAIDASGPASTVSVWVPLL